MPDVIVVGAGSAGSVVARRLLDAGAEVALLEAGRPDENPAIHDLSRMGELWHGPDDWDYFTTPQAHAAGRRLHWPRGKVLGGSHSLNASIYVRGAHADFDRWEREGATGWGWSQVLPYYRRIENASGVAGVDVSSSSPDALRGGSGLLDVTTDYPRLPIMESLHEAALQAGIPANPDYNGASIEGIGWEQINSRDGRRLSSYRAYVDPVVGSSALDVRTGVWIHRLLVEDGRVTGVVAEIDGALEELRASRVVLCAGALDTPRILLLSGIGPARDLEALGIRVVADVPGVGENLHDHLLAPAIFETTTREIAPPTPGVSVSQLHHFTRFREGLDVPDTQPIYFQVPMLDEGMAAPASSFTIHAGLVRPESRGTLKLASADPHAPALMDPNILSERADVESLVASLREVREIGRQAAVADASTWGAREVYPRVDLAAFAGEAGAGAGAGSRDLDLDSDAALERYVRLRAVTYHHQVGTARMGVDELAVVDPTSFAVRADGLDGLHVADASIMPSVPSGNTNAPSILIGERAADALVALG